MSGKATSSRTTSGASVRVSGERRRAVGRLADDVEPLGLEQRAGERPEAGVVVDDEDGRRHGRIVARGRVECIGAGPRTRAMRRAKWEVKDSSVRP